MLRVAAGQQDHLKLYGDDYPTADGSTIRDYIHVADLARAHLLALEWIPAGRHEVFNLGNGNGYTSKQVIDTVREVTGRPVPVEVAARRPGDFMRSVAGSDKARDVLGLDATAAGTARHRPGRVGIPPVRVRPRRPGQPTAGSVACPSFPARRARST